MESDGPSDPGTRQATFRRLIQEYSPALRRLTHSYEADASRSEDLFQEIALGLWQAIPLFRGDSSERTWFYRIAHNIAISAAESQRRRGRRETPLADWVERPRAAPLPEHALLAEERRQALVAAIRQLPAIDRQLISLHLEELSYAEIESISGLSQSAIASRLSRIRDRLAEAIRKNEVRK